MQHAKRVLVSAISCGARIRLTSALCLRRGISIGSHLVKISEEVQQAIAEKRPVVALESTIYTHGFPYPQNMVLATNLESIVRATGAVPATIGVLDGIARIGLDGDDLIRLASSSQDPEALLKVSRRDLSYALAARTPDGRAYTGGTTVAGTMILAHLAGIKIFSTGGLGGVHRGAAETWDVSADLTELGRTPVSVIAAGCKAFLDISKTVEYLETQGVAVVTLADGRTGNVDFPGFWSRDSGVRSPLTVTDELVVAQMIVAQYALGLQSGILIANPVPREHEIPFPEIQAAIDAALVEAADQNMTGNRATPFILAKIKELTGNRSVSTNTALVEHNVRVGSKIAMEVAFLEKYDESRRKQGTTVSIPRPTATMSKPSEAPTTALEAQTGTGRANTTQLSSPAVLIAGMLAVDFACDYRARKASSNRTLEMHTSNPARITQSLGGVGYNVARAINLCGVDSRLCSAVGADMNGIAALSGLRAAGLDEAGIVTLSEFEGRRRTAQYVAVNDESKELVVSMADMNILEHDDDSPDHLEQAYSIWQTQFAASSPAYMVIDANWSPGYLSRWLEMAKSAATRTLFEPVSNAKSTALFHMPSQRALMTYPAPSIHMATPNEHELSSMYDAAKTRGFLDRQDWWQIVDAFGIPSSGAHAKMVLATSSNLVARGIPQRTLQLLPYIPIIMTKLGPQGVLLTQIIPAGDPRLDEPEYAGYMLSRCTNGTEQELCVGGIYMRLFEPAEIIGSADIVSVNGVGDTFAGVLIAGLAKKAQAGQAERVEDLIDIAQRGSILTLKSAEAVSPGLGVLSMLL